MSVEPDRIVVTSAGLSGTEDRQLRMRRYLRTQLVRALCFVLAVALPIPVWGKLVFIVGAFVLPWMGVVTANAGPSKPVDRGPNAMLERIESLEPVRLQIEPGRVIDQD
jgi:hypothetical protein